MSGRLEAFDERQARELAEREYDIQGSASLLDGERDRNFRIDSEDRSYVLKIAPFEDSRAELELQAEVLEFLAVRALTLEVPRLVRTRGGERLFQISISGESHLGRLVTYLPGRLYARVADSPPALRGSLGRGLGELDGALAQFSHPAARRVLPWDLARARDMLRLAPGVRPDSLGLQVEEQLHRFCTVVEPVLPELRSSVIHNDANDYNLLVADDEERVSGIIDFGDMVETATICELAIAIAYAILGSEDPIPAAEEVVRGYHEVHPLYEREIEVLFDLVRTRLVTSVCISSRNRCEDPGNEYLQISEAPMREMVGRLHHVDAREVEAKFRTICGFDPRVTEGDGIDIPGLRQEHLSSTLSLSYREPLHITGGSGPYLFEEGGRAYLDLVNNVCHVGHCHPALVEAEICFQGASIRGFGPLDLVLANALDTTVGDCP